LDLCPTERDLSFLFDQAEWKFLVATIQVFGELRTQLAARFPESESSWSTLSGVFE
jgi:hypothetical protein